MELRKSDRHARENQTNSNDLTAPLPYKGIGTPSQRLSWWPPLSLAQMPLREREKERERVSHSGCSTSGGCCLERLGSAVAGWVWRFPQLFRLAATFASCQWSGAHAQCGLRRSPTPVGVRQGAASRPCGQRKRLSIPDGGHKSENSCKGLHFHARVWGSGLLPLPVPLPLLSLPVFFLPSASPYSVLKFQTALGIEGPILSAPLALLSSVFWSPVSLSDFPLPYFLLSHRHGPSLSPTPHFLAHSSGFWKN